MKATRQSFTLVNAQSTAANFNSNAYYVLGIDIEAIQIDYTGSPSGSFAIQGSCNHVEDTLGNILVAGTWANLYFSIDGTSPPVSTVAVPTNPSPIIFDMYGSGVQYIRVQYLGSGTGTFTAVVSGKRIGD
jgi:hypothetical protein